MEKKKETLSCCEFWLYILIVFIVWTVTWCLLCNCSTDKNSEINYSTLATVLSILISGSVAGFFSFEYYHANKKEIGFVTAIAWMFIISIYLLIILLIYCLVKIGLFENQSCFFKLAIYFPVLLLLCGIVLLDRWDSKKRNDNIEYDGIDKNEKIQNQIGRKVEFFIRKNTLINVINETSETENETATEGESHYGIFHGWSNVLLACESTEVVICYQKKAIVESEDDGRVYQIDPKDVVFVRK